jgi:hypothetical protein
MVAMDRAPCPDRARRRVRAAAAARRRRRLFRPVQNFRRPTNCATDRQSGESKTRHCCRAPHVCLDLWWRQSGQNSWTPSCPTACKKSHMRAVCKRESKRKQPCPAGSSAVRITVAKLRSRTLLTVTDHTKQNPGRSVSEAIEAPVHPRSLSTDPSQPKPAGLQVGRGLAT